MNHEIMDRSWGKSAVEKFCLHILLKVHKCECTDETRWTLPVGHPGMGADLVLHNCNAAVQEEVERSRIEIDFYQNECI